MHVLNLPPLSLRIWKTQNTYLKEKYKLNIFFYIIVLKSSSFLSTLTPVFPINSPVGYRLLLYFTFAKDMYLPRVFVHFYVQPQCCACLCAMHISMARVQWSAHCIAGHSAVRGGGRRLKDVRVRPICLLDSARRQMRPRWKMMMMRCWWWCWWRWGWR